MKAKTKKIIKWSLISILSLVTILVAFGAWFISLIPKPDKNQGETTPVELAYLSQDSIPTRGKILAVVTSTDMMGSSGKPTGYELTELSRAYYVFEANGFEVDVASPLGGDPPVVIDNEDMGPFDYAFLNDPIASKKRKNTIPINQIDPEAYDAVYFVGGKGAMYDFPENRYIQNIVRSHYQSDKVVGAVCHGPAALVNVSLDNGQSIVDGKNISSFTNKEELFLIPDAATIFPFLLQEELERKGAQFSDGIMYLENVSHDGNLITGQNPWSTWTLAEKMIVQLGYTPKPRNKTPDELAIKVLMVYEKDGVKNAKQTIDVFYSSEVEELNRTLLAMHAIVGTMQGRIGKTASLIRLLSYAKKKSED
ncbi:MAG: type 1 glutamine amidotransferase domain-containing protein [Bacteroidota bacterium]